MSDKFLKEHCNLAWEISVYNCNLIIDGLVDIEQQKLFVSSLQNAIEICYKQVMIDNCDYRVVNYSKISDISKVKEYLNAIDLNAYFKSLDVASIQKLYTVDFNEIIDFISKDVNETQNIDIKSKLKILKELRNNESHFYIDTQDYLSFENFKILCWLLDYFCKFFRDKRVIGDFFGEPRDADKNALLYFNKDSHSCNSYNEYVGLSKTNKELWMQFPKYDSNDETAGYHYTIRNLDDLFGIAHIFYCEIYTGERVEIKHSFYDFYRRFKLLVENQILNLYEYVEDEPDIVRNEDGVFETTVPYASIVVSRKKD